MLILEAPRFHSAAGTTTVHCGLYDDRDGSRRRIEVSVDEQHADLLDRVTADGFVTIAAIQSMVEHRCLRVDGPLSERLHLALTGAISHMTQLVVPGIGACEIDCDHLVSGADLPPAAAGVGTGFTGGVDSFCVLHDHFAASDVPPHRRITHLVYSNNGANGREADKRVWQDSCAHLTAAAKDLSLPLVPVDSNLPEFLTIDFGHSHSFRNLGIAMILSGGLGRYLYASGLPYADSTVKPADVITVADPALVAMLSTTRLHCIPSGSEYTRTEKTRLIASLPATRKHLDVCVWGERNGNCSTCYKCLRTLTTLEALGVLEDYGDAFDLDRYRGIRAYWLASLLASNKAIEGELARFVRSSDLPIPLKSRLAAPFLRLVGQETIKKLKQLVRRRHPLATKV